MRIITSSFDPENTIGNHKPLMIGCSGGGGHNSAIQGIARYLENIYDPKNVQLHSYPPVLYAEKEKSSLKQWMQRAMKLMHAEVIGAAVRKVVHTTRYPILPHREEINAEVRNLNRTQEDIKAQGGRKYIDMLLDVYPAGYESAALWNVLQRKDRVKDLKKLIAFQRSEDKKAHDTVEQFYFQLLKASAVNGEPYTELVSTQALSLPGLCDAVIRYNKWLERNPSLKAPKMVIHQYMTDLPTEGAVHFLDALSALSMQQQQQMKLYGVGVNQEILEDFFPKKTHFKKIINVPSHKNPMVRPGFNDPLLDKSNCFHKDITLLLAGNESYKVAADQQIASIMLGSQAGLDTVEYIETLIESGVSKIFVFGGQSPELSSKIDEIVKRHPHYAEHVIRLKNQSDKEIAPLMSRSNIVIIRGGGLSIMEQLAMRHSKEQTILIHHTNRKRTRKLSSGISWEDANAANLLSNFKKQGLYAVKTSPNHAKRHVPEARLLAATQRTRPDLDPEEVRKHISNLSNATVIRHCKALAHSEAKTPPELPIALSNYLAGCEEKAKKTTAILNVLCLKAQERLEKIIGNEIEKMHLSAQYMKLDKEHAPEHTDILDVGKIIRHAKNKEFNSSPKFQRAVKSYKALKQLQSTINPNNKTTSESMKLDCFQQKFEDPKIKKEFFSCPDNAFVHFIKEILFQLSKINIFRPLVEKHLTHELKIKREVYDLKHQERKSAR